VSYVLEPWPIPGEEPLQVRFCTRKGHPMNSFCHMQEVPKRAVVLHHTSGLGHLGTLMGNRGFISIHFMVGRDGNVYRFCNSEYMVNHAPPFSSPSIGIEVDNMGRLVVEKDNLLHGEPSKDDHGNRVQGPAYCTLDDKDAYVEKRWRNDGEKYWATWTEGQYKAVGQLLKALCAKHKIPKMILPVEHRFEGFSKQDMARFHGICHHVNISPDRRDDLGPYVDWDKIVANAGLSIGDCFNHPSEGGAPRPAKKPVAKSREEPKPKAKKTEEAAPKLHAKAEPPPEPLPSPVEVDSRTVRLKIGPRPGRIALSVRKAGDPIPVSPADAFAPGPLADGKRDEFLRHAMSFLGVPFKSGSMKPADGLDGPGLVTLCLRRAGLLTERDADAPIDGPTLAGYWPPSGSNPEEPPPEILPGDLAWFGSGDHERSDKQHPMIWLGGGRLLGAMAEGGRDHGAVQIVHLADVPDHFTGWSHIDDLGEQTAHTAHPGNATADVTAITAALLPQDPAQRWEALKQIVQDGGGKWSEEKGKINLVGVKDLVDRCYVSPSRGGWNDTLYACFVDGDGNKLSLELRSSLDPANDDEAAGKWHLADGSYQFKLQDSALVPDGTVKGFLDVQGLGSLRPVQAAKEEPDPQVDHAQPPNTEGA
jgi:N-acetyl-anhydromuramyl-L-alanine amidase AmpD/cell wall-associated NlpC family hydrolase